MTFDTSSSMVISDEFSRTNVTSHRLYSLFGREHFYETRRCEEDWSIRGLI